MKKGKRIKHHHHRMTSLLLQYSHLNEEQKREAFESDVLRIAEALDAAGVVRVLEKIISKLKAKS